MAMLPVVPMHEAGRPDTRLHKISKTLCWELGPVLGRSEQGLGIAVVAVQHGLGIEHRDALGQRGASQQVGRMISAVTVMDLPANDLAAVQVQDHVEVEPAPLHVSGQIGHVPAPDLTSSRGDVRRRRA